MGDRNYDIEENNYYTYIWEPLYSQFICRIENEEYVKVDKNVYDDRYGKLPGTVKVYWSASARDKKKHLDHDEILAQVDIYAKENECYITLEN